MWVQIVLWVISIVVSAATAPKPKAPTPGEVSGVVTAAAGQPIPVLFGTRLIQAPNVVWWGDVKTVAIQEKGGKK